MARQAYNAWLITSGSGLVPPLSFDITNALGQALTMPNLITSLSPGSVATSGVQFPFPGTTPAPTTHAPTTAAPTTTHATTTTTTAAPTTTHATAAPTTTAATTTPATGLVVYGDSLSSPWADYSWSVTNNFAATNFVYSGTKSIQTQVTAAWGGLYLHNPNGWGLSTYQTLAFHIYPTVAGVQFTVGFYGKVNGTSGTGLGSASLGSLSAGAWITESFTLATYKGTATQFDGFFIQTNVATTFNVDYITLQ